MASAPSPGGEADLPASDPAASSGLLPRPDLLDAADRVIERLGPDVPMSRIAAEAGITKPVLYRHFGSKSGLYQALATRYTTQLLMQLRRALEDAPDPVARVRAGVEVYLRFIESHPRRYRFLMHRAVGEDLALRSSVSAFTRLVGREIAVALEAMLGREDRTGETSRVWGQAIVGLVQAAGDWWLERDDVPRERMTNHLTRLIWQGLEGASAPGE